MHLPQKNGDVKISAVKRSFDIVETLLRLQGASTVNLAEELDIPVSTAFDHLDTLMKLGYVVKDGDRYRVSTMFLNIGIKMRNRRGIYSITTKDLQELADQTGLYTTLMIEENGFGVHLDIAESEAGIPSIANPGTRTKLHSTSAGKVLLAEMDTELIEEIVAHHGLPATTENTITDADELFEELVKVREQRYGVDREEGIRGLYGVSVPVVNRYSDETVAAIAVYGPSDQDIDQFVDRVLDPLKSTANAIEIKHAYG